MDLGLAGRVALVCGSTQGLGRAVAQILAREGALVAVNGRHDDAATRAADQLTAETGHRVAPFAADVGVPAQAWWSGCTMSWAGSTCCSAMRAARPPRRSVTRAPRRFSRP